MMWFGLIGGIVLGAMMGGLGGAVALGFIGWLGGLIVGSATKSVNKAMSVAATPDEPAGDETLDPTLEDRVARLEHQLARVHARLANLDPTFVPETETGAKPGPGPGLAPVWPAGVVPDAAPAAMVRDPIPAAKEIGPRTVAAAAASGATGSAGAASGVTPPEPVQFDEPPGPPTEPLPPREPPGPPPEPNPIVEWFMGVNAIARVGMVILFFGLSFLIKYAADNNMFPPELRVAAVGIAGIALLVIGWRTREKKRGFALSMQGAGVAVLYLTIFGAMKLYGLIPPELAFFLLAGIAVFSAILAILQDAVALAVIGAGGGFIAPILVSTGGGNHAVLFSYYLLLNLGILAIAWYKAWRALNLTGFLFTFFIGLSWGERSYRPELLDTTEPFLIAFFLVFVALAILVAREKTMDERKYVDGTITFGAPITAFGIQAVLMRPIEYGLAFSSLALAAFYVILAWRLHATRRESWALLAQSFLALGVVFATLAIPLALDARWTSASWALEGAAVFWVGLRQQRTIARAFGLLLQILAGVSFFKGYHRLPDDLVMANPAFMGAALMALAGLWLHRLMKRNDASVSDVERGLAIPVYAWGLAWTLFAGIDELQAQVPGRLALMSLVLFFSGVAVVFGSLGKRWEWREATWTARALLPILIGLAAVQFVDAPHPLGRLGWIAWPVALAVHIWILRTIEPELAGRYTTFLHAGGMLLMAALGARELHWIASTYTQHHTAWSLAALVVVPAALLMLASSRSVDDRWPIAEEARAYRYLAAVPIVVYFAVWSLFGNITHNAASDPLPYLPLLNAVDLAHILVAIAIVSWWLGMRRSGIEPPSAFTGRGGLVIGGALVFIWLNAILLRTISHWADIPYTQSAMMRSIIVQTSLSIFWTVLALTAMVYATRSSRRPLWMLGAALMGVVVVKLFLIDLSHVGGIQRIVSFIGVGVLMLVVGYFSPVPPKTLDPEKPL